MSDSEKVLASFRKFDADSSGAISREELGEVLKALDEGAWNDESIDVLLAQADASGDGQLQFQEFLSWVFAEDQKGLGAATGDFTLVITGCSRESLNGEYAQVKGKVCGGRPVFRCAANNKILFYRRQEERWQVFHKPGKFSSCRLPTKRAAHMAGDAKWMVWQPEKKAFEEESSMECKILIPDRKEELAKAPDILRPSNTAPYGTFTRRGCWMVDRRPLYFCGEDDTFLIYSEKVQKWKICRMAKEDDGTSDGPVVADRENLERENFDYSLDYIPGYMKNGKRAIDNINTEKLDYEYISRIGLGYSFPLGWSEQTTSYSPAKATWHHPEEDYVITWEAVDPTPSPDPEAGWIDPAFPHDSFSLGDPAKVKFKRSAWVRAIHLCKDPVLFGDLEPADAIQGAMGNCGMVAALAALAEFPEYLSSLFNTKELSADGKYEIRMFLPLGFENIKTEKAWGTIEVDDYLPCVPPPKEGVLSGARPFFMGLANGNKLYMVLLEKCFAKASGSYQALYGFDSRTVWKALTGCEDTFCYTDVWTSKRGKDYYNQPEWQVTAAEVMVSEEYGGQSKGRLMQGATFKEVERRRYHVKFQKLEGEGPEEGWLPYFVSGKRTAKRTSKRWWLHYVDGYPEMDDMFEKLVELDRANYVMCTGPRRRAGMREDGLVFPHAYSVLHAVHVKGLKMVCLRNPWGHGEWRGPWGDQGEEWKLYPDVAEALKFDEKDNGTFWMEWEDFEWNCGGVDGLSFSIPAEKSSKVEV